MIRKSKTIALGIVVSLVAASLTLTACSSNDKKTANDEKTPTAATFPMELDSCGNTVTVEKQPKKVLTIGPDPLALMSASGAGSFLKHYSALLGMKFPKLEGISATELTDQDPSAEQIIETGVDFVIPNAFINADPKTLEAAGIKIWVPSTVCDHMLESSSGMYDATVSDKPIMEKIQDDLQTMGKLFGTTKTAEAAAAEMKKNIESASNDKPGKGKRAAILYYFDNTYPVGVTGAGGMAGVITKTLGFDNVFGDNPEFWLMDVTWEAILEKNPEVIILIDEMTPGMNAETSKKRLLAESGADKIKAVQDDAILHIPYYQVIQAPIAFEGLKGLAEELRK
ncbi:ABC transporter substrate-binding protein [Mobiluncus mulieris]|uniref:ABC transporter substrate-binding protein n=1 Tax=Mobiluncus mulieris TaxID=2052 RepID=UPI0014705530|nr:ABC transporter substrate-binding protein [Mobiluncus mulieris]MCV0009854.1 ABC transporter substrate-binding protein [Mobiluncus mulieris]NMX02172.1 ABC transporter substrate-binding protein [Mobiluncus mulieris]NMX20654.1 ABC transporter substrate-binding protein [Mobiluncus mulieris]